MGVGVMAKLAVVISAVIGVAPACSSSPAENETASSVTGSCAWIAGRWSWNGCGETSCTFYEDDCQVHYDCSSPQNAISGTGMIADNNFTFGGGECTATVNGKSMGGKCPGCSFTATHK